MSLKWTDTLDIAIELADTHTDVDPSMFVLPIFTAGYARSTNLTMTPIDRMKKFWKRFKWPGVMKRIEWSKNSQFIDRKPSRSRHISCSESNTLGSLLTLFKRFLTKMWNIFLHLFNLAKPFINNLLGNKPQVTYAYITVNLVTVCLQSFLVSVN